MKKLLFSFAVLALLAACSDDDENNNGNNDVPQPTILTKQIAKIEMTETEDGQTPQKQSWEYAYNEAGKIISITDKYGKIDPAIKYEGNKVTLTYDVDGFNYMLDNGRVSTFTYVGKYEDESSTGECRYEDGYLSEITEKGDDFVSTSTFSFRNGCLVKYELTEVGDDDEDGPLTETCEFTYTTNRPNNLNIDLFGWLTEVDENAEPAMLLGIGGNRSVCLPDVMKYIEDGDAFISNFKYVTDADGYITKITVTGEDYKTEYVITYKD